MLVGEWVGDHGVEEGAPGPPAAAVGAVAAAVGVAAIPHGLRRKGGTIMSQTANAMEEHRPYSVPGGTPCSS